MKDTYIAKLRIKYTGFKGVKFINLIHHMMEIYSQITETDLKEHQKKFDEALDTTISIYGYFEKILNCMQYANDIKQPFKAAQIINNTCNVVLATGLYTEQNKM